MTQAPQSGSSLICKNISFTSGAANRLFPRSLIFPEHRHLPAGDLIALDGVPLGEVGAHVIDKAARYSGR